MKKKASMLIGIGMPGLDIEKMMFDPVRTSQSSRCCRYFEIKRLGLPTVTVSDGPALRISPTRLNDSNTYFATAFPVGTSLASTWNES
jgi:beta-glucosidase